MNLSKQKSNAFYVARAFAIFSVICAHMSFGKEYVVPEIIRGCISEIGVCVFFLVSGFFYQRKSGDTVDFWKKKFIGIIIPWFFISTLVFLVSAVLLHALDFTVFSFIKNFLGIGTHFWYMTVLIITFILFKFITKKWQYITCMTISVISVYTSAIVLAVYSSRINQFLNVFNWIGFFALGIILRETDAINTVLNLNKKIVLLFSSGLCMVVCICIQILTDIPTNSYISLTSLPFELSGIVFVLVLSDILCNNRVLADIGKKSFFIYLTQIQFVGFINTRLPYNTVFFILRPIISLIICYILSVLFVKALKFLKLEKVSVLFGIK